MRRSLSRGTRRYAFALAALLPSAGGPARAPAPPIAREWRARVTQPDGTDLVVRMTIAFPSTTRWEAYTRPGAATEMIPWYTAWLGRLLRKLPPHGALLSVTGGVATPSGDSLILRGMVESPVLGSPAVRGALRGDRFHLTLVRAWDTTVVAGEIDAVPETSDRPVRDYPAIAREMRRVTNALVYDARLPETSQFQRFFADLDAAFARARDDLDAVAAFYALNHELETTHFNFIRNPKIAATPLDSLVAGDPSVNPDTLVRFDFTAEGLAYLYIRRWDRVGPAIDRAFARIDSAKAKVLILDVRGNPGGDATSIVPVTHLLRDTTPVGVFVGRKWYAAHDRPPAAGQLDSLPVISSETEAKQLLNLIYAHGGALGRVPPRAPVFDGTVFLLVDRNTGSASEPLAYVLQQTHRATLIGGRTAGAMLTALPHPVGDGFILTVPEADYYAADGVRLEGRGVEPDLRASSADALIVVGDEVKKILPYAGSVWLGYSYNTLKRYAESERAWNDALALAPSEAARVSIRRRIEAVRRAQQP